MNFITPDNQFTSLFPEFFAHNVFSHFEMLLKEKKSVYIFLSGGSLEETYPYFLPFVEDCGIYKKGQLGFGQIDERFHPENPEDINFSHKNIQLIYEKSLMYDIPFLYVDQDKKNLKSATSLYDEKIKNIFENEKIGKISLLGIGEDMHTAGLLPSYEKKWNIDTWAAGYLNSGQYKKRLSLTPKALRKMDVTFVYMKGEKKAEVSEKLKKKEFERDLNKSPMTILDEIENKNNVFIYSDTKLEN